jgi:hypothetical protein
MAGRIRNRRELRRQAEEAGQPAGPAPGATPAAAPAGKKAGAKGRAAPAGKKVRAKKVPPRLRARWGVFDGSMKQVAIFDYDQRAAADEKLAALLAKNKGIHFLQIVKEPMPAPAPAAAAPPDE